jgi:TPR repeat protein
VAPAHLGDGAQAALGYMYRNGQGVTQDDTAAADWYLRAYVLCNVALAQGNARGLHCRDEAAHYLTKAEKTRAASMVVKWQELSSGQ